jgi:alpha-D-xyloside xylohydrolase
MNLCTGARQILYATIHRIAASAVVAATLAALLLACSPQAAGQWNPINAVKDFQKQPDGIVVLLDHGALKLQVCSPSIVRVIYSPTTAFPPDRSHILTRTSWPPADFNTQSDDKRISLTTTALKIVITRATSTIEFDDASGKKLTAEDDRTMTPVDVNGEHTYRAERFTKMWDSQESFYGLGQHQAGVWDYRGESVDLSQDNTNISVPFLLSSNGYAIFWNNASRSRFNNRYIHALYLTSEVADVIDYFFIYGPDFDKLIAAYRDLTGQAPLFGQWSYGYWQCKNRYDSQAELLGIAQKYRDLHLPLDNLVQDWFWWNIMGEPVFSKNYPDPKAMGDTLHREHVHLMVSVWPYFRPGSSTYDEMDRRGFFIEKTKVAGFHPAGMALYDAFNPEARKYYWQLMNDALFKIGVDAWWLDTTEPETEGREENILLRNNVAIGSGARYLNLYPVMTTEGVYEGQRAAGDQKRVFILSRSGFAGVQRNAAAVWSGDINPNWETFRRQIPAGLNLSLSGIPYWTTDIGGFVTGNPDDPAYRELYIRWFEFGAFCPIFRAHGTRATNQNELWSYGPEAQSILASYDRLRYRLLPYIYSVAWKTTNEGYTPMRALAMDYRNDVTALHVSDQFMYGPALLVNPVTQPGATSRQVYLPQSKWYDFWTGAVVPANGRMFTAAAPIDKMPLYVRAGSILPIGPDEEYSGEKSSDPLELRIYPGANGDFTLYEDEGDTYNYERGAYSTIALHWEDKAGSSGAGTLTIGARHGRFPGMLEKRIFRVVIVSENHGNGTAGATSAVGKVVTYDGSPTEVTIAY